MTIHEEKIVKWEQIKNQFEFAHSISKLNKNEQTLAQGMFGFLSAIVDDLKILHKHTEAITEAAHSANANVGRSAAVVNDEPKVNSEAASSETGIVGQNEQTKEVCHCNFERMVGWNEDVGNYCLSCGKPMAASATSLVS